MKYKYIFLSALLILMGIKSLASIPISQLEEYGNHNKEFASETLPENFDSPIYIEDDTENYDNEEYEIPLHTGDKRTNANSHKEKDIVVKRRPIVLEGHNIQEDKKQNSNRLRNKKVKFRFLRCSNMNCKGQEVDINPNSGSKLYGLVTQFFRQFDIFKNNTDNNKATHMVIMEMRSVHDTTTSQPTTTARPERATAVVYECVKSTYFRNNKDKYTDGTLSGDCVSSTGEKLGTNGRMQNSSLSSDSQKTPVLIEVESFPMKPVKYNGKLKKSVVSLSLPFEESNTRNMNNKRQDKYKGNDYYKNENIDFDIKGNNDNSIVEEILSDSLKGTQKFRKRIKSKGRYKSKNKSEHASKIKTSEPKPKIITHIKKTYHRPRLHHEKRFKKIKIIHHSPRKPKESDEYETEIVKIVNIPKQKHFLPLYETEQNHKRNHHFKARKKYANDFPGKYIPPEDSCNAIAT